MSREGLAAAAGVNSVISIEFGALKATRQHASQTAIH